MIIDKTKVKNRFKFYTANYDLSDAKIGLKAAHTYRVAELSERIAKSLNLSEQDTSLAWLIGMLHDIARFEQCRIYDSFIDSATVDHARFGAYLLFGHSEDDFSHVNIADYGRTGIREYIEDEQFDQLIHDAIFYHNVYRLPENLDDRTKTFLNILRDADKIDILRVNVETPLEEVYNVSTKTLRNDTVSKEVMDSLYLRQATDRRLKKTSVDNVVGHISLVFELVYPESCVILKEQKYIYKLLNFESENEITRAQFETIRQFMDEYLRSL